MVTDWVHYSHLIVSPGNLDGCFEKHYSDQHIYDVKFSRFSTTTKPLNHSSFNKSTFNCKFEGNYFQTRIFFNNWSVYTSRLGPCLHIVSISVSGETE